MSKFFNIIAKEGKARAGILKVRGKEVETPFFMPVSTKMTAKHIGPDDLKSMRCNAIISNGFILSLRPGDKYIKRRGGIGNFMKFDGLNFTDSGGFQMYTKTLYIKSDDNGVEFRNPFDGKKEYITPEKDMDFQLNIGSDVAMCLDSMPLIEESKEAITKAVDKTTNWAKRCKEHHDEVQEKLSDEKKQILHGIIQGGIHPDLREVSAKALVELDFDGYSIGGLALGEAKEDEYKMIEVCKKIIPEDKHVYLMGAGNPLELLEAIYRGCDMFDSRFPTQNARHGGLFTNKGKIILTNKEFENDDGPIEEGCECFVCKNYSKAYVRHLLKQQEGSGYRYASYHNLWFLQRLMEKARVAIKEGKFGELLEEFRKFY
jgi:queuine tRNA-ribosyltransferase